MKRIIILLFVFILGNAVFALDCNVYKLENGQTVIIKQISNNPIVTIDTWVKTGSINEDEKNNGVSHFLEHLFFKGTKNRAPGEFDKMLESKGAITNAATSKDFTHYYITIPSKYFDLAMELHADMLLNPLIPRKELEKERKVVMEEIAKDQNNPNEKVFDNLTEMLYTTHPYKRKVIGTNEIIGKISREEILEYYNTHYGPQNMITVIIGDVEPQHALNEVKENFKTAPRQLTKNINKPEKQLSQKVVKTDYQPIQGGYILIGWRGANVSSTDTYALDVLATILGDGRSSILYQTIKEQKQLAYSISANNATYKEDGIFAINANFTPENTERLQKAIFEEIAKIQKQGITQEQLTRAQGIIERDTYYSRESISNIAQEIGYTTILTDNPKYYDEYLANIKKITLGEVKKAAESYLDLNKCAISIVLPPEDPNKKVSNITPVSHQTKLIKETKTTQKYQLDNGATFLLSPNDFNDIIAISIYAKGGEFLTKTAGVGDFTASGMTKGTKNYSSAELAEIMEENGIKISPTITADAFTIDVLTTKPQLRKTLELLNEVVNNATFEETEIEKIRMSKLNAIKKSRDIPMNLAVESFKDAIFESSVYSYGPKVYEKTFPKIQRQEVVDYYNSIFNPKNIVISINGNVDKDELANFFSEIFAKKEQCAFDYTPYATKIPTISITKKVTKQVKDLKTAWIIIGWQTPGVLKEKECATFQVIDSILGSGMSSRLFKDIREKEGLAYQLGSSFSPKILRGSFALFIGTNPKTVVQAQKLLLAEIERLKTEFVSDKELREAKDKIIGNYIISQETNLEKASSIGWYETSGRGFEYKNRYERLINSISASDIIEVANKYLNQNYVNSTVEAE